MKVIKPLSLMVFGLVVVMYALYYFVEPRLFNMDDGPYYSKTYTGPIDTLTASSSVELKRNGRIKYILESLLDQDKEGSVLILKRTDGEILWQKRPIKTDGSLGPVEVNQKYTRARLFGYGGWNVSIHPKHQESGTLYLGPLGNFRYFYHSW